jgi:hypothetical protein
LGPDDIDLAELHDASAVAELTASEWIGLSREGDGARLVRDAYRRLVDLCQSMYQGVLLSRGHPGAATGAAQIVELVWQLQGRAGKRQVENARVGLAHSAGGRVGDETPVRQLLFSSGIIDPCAEPRLFVGKKCSSLRWTSPRFFYGEQTYSYRELNDRVTRLATVLTYLGLKKGDRVAIITDTETTWARMFVWTVARWSGHSSNRPRLHPAEAVLHSSRFRCTGITLATAGYFAELCASEHLLPSGHKVTRVGWCIHGSLTRQTTTTRYWRNTIGI